MIAFIDDHRAAYGVVLREPQDEADLQSAADRPVNVPCSRRAAGRPEEAAGPGQAGRGADGRDPARVRGELPRLRRAQGLAATRPRRNRGRPLHRGAADAGDRLGWSGARWEGAIPPARRNQRKPTGWEIPTAIAASSLDRPAAMNAQNRRRASRDATPGRPGDLNLPRRTRSERRRPAIATPSVKPLRRPLESTQYVSIRYTERLAEAGIEPSVGSVGNSYDNLWTPPAARFSSATTTASGA